MEEVVLLEYVLPNRMKVIITNLSDSRNVELFNQAIANYKPNEHKYDGSHASYCRKIQDESKVITKSESKRKPSDICGQFRVVPNEKGIKINNGGLCSPK